MTRQLRILILEDQPEYIDILALRLQEDNVEAKITLVGEREDYIQALKSSKFDAIISDYVLPDINGKEALALAKQICPETPLVIFTGSVDEETAVECMKQGAVDYVLKQQPTRLVPALLSAVEQARQREVLQELQAQVKQTLQWQEAIFEGSSDAVFVSDSESRFISVNKAACELTGFTRQELLTMKIPDLHEEPDLKAYHDSHERIMQGEEVLSEAKIRRKDGSKVDTEFNNKRIIISGATYMHTRARDITQRKQAETILRESEKKYQELVNTLQEGIWVIDKDSFTNFVNPHMAKMLDYTVDEMQGKHLFSFMDEQGIEISKRNLERRRQGIKEAHDFELLTKGGRRIQTIMNTAPILDDNDNYAGAIAAVVDITERKRAEKEIVSLAKFPSENPNPIFRITRDGTLLYVNEAGLSLLSDWNLQVGKPASPILCEAVFQSMNSGKAQVLDIEYGKRVYSFYVAPVVALHYANLYGRDITEHKQKEKQLRALSGRIQSIREEEKTRIARQIHDEFGQVLSAFKMDLSSIGTGLGKLNIPTDGIQGKIQGMMDVIDSTLGRVHEIISDLRPHILDNLGLAEAISWYAEQFQARTGIRCSVDASDLGGQLDQQQTTALFRILQESLTNVARHSGATTVEISLGQESGMVNLTVKNNGKSITDAQIADRTSLGILGMKERSTILGGELKIDGTHEGGTTLIASIPVNKK